MLSIIIPTLNEEKYLPRLLRSIKKQAFDKKLEIIVANADSKDRTKEIAQKLGAKVVKGGNLSQGRNRGARAAQGEILLISDADVILAENFLKKALQEFERQGLDGATFFIYPIKSTPFQRLLFIFFYNYLVLFLNRIIPLGSTVFLVKKKIHQEIGGFDEETIFLEDREYVQKLANSGKYRVLKTPHILISTRRFRRDGWIKTYLKLLVGHLYFLLRGPIKKDIFHYKFGSHHNLPD